MSEDDEKGRARVRARARSCAGAGCGCDEAARGVTERTECAVRAIADGRAFAACEALRSALLRVADMEREATLVACHRMYHALHRARAAARAIRELIFIRFGAMLEPRSRAQHFCGNIRCERCTEALRMTAEAHGAADPLLTESDPVIMQISAILCSAAIQGPGSTAVAVIRFPPDTKSDVQSYGLFCRLLSCLSHDGVTLTSAASPEQPHGASLRLWCSPRVSHLGAPVCEENLSAHRESRDRTPATPSTPQMRRSTGALHGALRPKVSAPHSPAVLTRKALHDGIDTRGRRDDNVRDVACPGCCATAEGAEKGMAGWPAYWVYPEHAAARVRSHHWATLVSMLQNRVFGSETVSWPLGTDGVFVELDERADVAYAVARVSPSLGLVLIAPTSSFPQNSRHEHSLKEPFIQAARRLTSVISAVPPVLELSLPISRSHSDRSEDSQTLSRSSRSGSQFTSPVSRGDAPPADL
eukprot:CAMPEP_0185837366 /NCGR_PEP_ID=MMETSP1353-20130828/11279_1 /TAXON_ID=1077150 /ORGANISM="Erythrolobus australicus, Strain CCMP3124" /LENGTH=471 /DNA_ID=CAMNT_0028536271 /DNA_START=60 /DNA_END=1471 /DNA_ORIENTATION=-